MHSNNMPNVRFLASAPRARWGSDLLGPCTQHPSFLEYIQTPPGNGSGGLYDTQGVTRSYSLQWYAFKVPLSPVLLPTASAAANNEGGIGFTSADDLYSSNSLTRMPTSGPAAYALNGSARPSRPRGCPLALTRAPSRLRRAQCRGFPT